MDGKIYRQRLTTLGIIGAMLGICAPLVIALSVSNHLDRAARYALMGRSAPEFPVVEVIFVLVLAQVGWVMVLIGREYYPYTLRMLRPKE